VHYNKSILDLVFDLLKRVEFYKFCYSLDFNLILETFLNFELLDTTSNQEELDRKQREYIKKYNSLELHGYNLTEE